MIFCGTTRSSLSYCTQITVYRIVRNKVCEKTPKIRNVRYGGVLHDEGSETGPPKQLVDTADIGDRCLEGTVASCTSMISTTSDHQLQQPSPAGYTIGSILGIRSKLQTASSLDVACHLVDRGPPVKDDTEDNRYTYGN